MRNLTITIIEHVHNGDLVEGYWSAMEFRVERRSIVSGFFSSGIDTCEFFEIAVRILPSLFQYFCDGISFFLSLEFTHVSRRRNIVISTLQVSTLFPFRSFEGLLDSFEFGIRIVVFVSLDSFLDEFDILINGVEWTGFL